VTKPREGKVRKIEDRVEGWVTAHAGLLLMFAATVLLVGGGFGLVLLSLWLQPTYSAEVRTEILSVRMNASNTHRWFMVKPRLLIDNDTVTIKRDSGFVELFQPLDVTLSRHGNGKLLVQIERAVDDDDRSDERLGPIAIFHWTASDTIKADTAMTFLGVQMDSTPNPLTFPFVGWAILGADVPAVRRFAPMLLSGRVEIYGKIFNQRYRAGGVELEAGDKFAVIQRPSKEKEEEKKVGYGIVRIDPPDGAVDSRGMLVTYHAEGKEAQVSRFGTGGHRLSMSWLVFLTSNPLFGVLAVVVVAIYTGLITAIWEKIVRGERGLASLPYPASSAISTWAQRVRPRPRPTRRGRESRDAQSGGTS